MKYYSLSENTIKNHQLGNYIYMWRWRVGSGICNWENIQKGMWCDIQREGKKEEAKYKASFSSDDDSESK